MATMKMFKKAVTSDELTNLISHEMKEDIFNEKLLQQLFSVKEYQLQIGGRPVDVEVSFPNYKIKTYLRYSSAGFVEI
jgi:hypothetical protein